MSTLQERIAEIMEVSGMTVGDISAVTKVSSSAVSQWKDGPTKSVKLEPATLLSEKTGFCAVWISSGKGPKRTSQKISVSPEAPTLAQALETIDAALEPLDANSREIAVGMLSGLKLPGNHEMVASMLSGAISARKAHTKDLEPRTDELTQQTRISVRNQDQIQKAA